MANRFFIADTHFGHSNICKFESETRPFDNIKQMDDCLVDAWNSVVKSGDEVYHLGDFAFNKKFNGFQLNGKIHLLRGNHDPKRDDCFNHRFNTVKDLRKIRYTWYSPGLQGIGHKVERNRETIILCHYPLETWEGSFEGSYMLHGHSHGRLPCHPYRKLDVGVDALVKMRIRRDRRNYILPVDYAPISIDDVRIDMNSLLNCPDKKSEVI